MKIYNVGIIGYGVMAGHHKNQLLKGNVRARVRGMFDINPERLAAAQAEGFIAYPSVRALLSDKEIDIVVVSTPNDYHKAYAIMALRAGKHVIMEKPATLSATEFSEVIAEAEKAGRVLTVDQNRRTNRDFVLLKNCINEGLLSKPYMIESHVEGSRGTFGWRCEKEHGGGMIYDWGVHLIDQLLTFTDKKVTSVYCNTFSVHYEGIDDNFCLTLVFEDGLVGKIDVSTNAYITHPRWYAACENGTLVIESWACDGKIIRTKEGHVGIGEAVESKAGPTRTMAPRDPDSVEAITLSEPQGIIDNLDPVYEQLISGIEGGELKITPAQVLRTMKIVDAAFLSASSGSAVKTDI